MNDDRLFNWGLVLLVVLFAGMLLFHCLGFVILSYACLVGLGLLGALGWVIMMMNAPW